MDISLFSLTKIIEMPAEESPNNPVENADEERGEQPRSVMHIDEHLEYCHGTIFIIAGRGIFGFVGGVCILDDKQTPRGLPYKGIVRFLVN